MLCFKRFSYLSVFVFSLLACTLLSTIITSGDVYAEANIWTYTWGQYSASEKTVTPVPNHVYDNTFCGYKYFYISGSKIDNFNFKCSINNSSSGFIIPNFPNLTIPELSGQFSYNITTDIITNCSVKPLYMGSTVILSDEPISSVPTGTLSITENGTYDVTNYASAEVDVPPIYGDYHDDLVDIKKAIYTGCAVLLVLYFFYCIYRMIIKGVKR